MALKIGTAGWAIPRAFAGAFPTEGSSLERYAGRFAAAEINSAFHRPHRTATWERWRASVPPSFRFSVKLPKLITHQRKLMDYADALDAFLAEATLLEDKLAVLLVQLPPKLELDEKVATRFFGDLAERSKVRIACEPRNPTWFTPAADRLLRDLKVARVAADPAVCEAAAEPGGWSGLSYWRLHGSPVMYRSSYGDRIESYVAKLKQASRGGEAWCIFDNTASSAAMGDALALMQRMGG